MGDILYNEKERSGFTSIGNIFYNRNLNLLLARKRWGSYGIYGVI